MKGKGYWTAWIGMSCLVITVGFQNCGGEFLAREFGSLQGSSGGNNYQLPPLRTEKLIYSEFRECRNRSGPEGLVYCLSQMGIRPPALNQNLVDQCVGVAGPGEFELAMCLTQAGVPVHGYRLPKQADVDTCLERVGVDGLAPCLERWGVLWEGLSQEDLANCHTNAGADNVEKCLRANGLIPERKFISQREVNICDAVEGQSRLAICLDNSGLLPEGVDQVVIAGCIGALGKGNIVRCLRRNGHVPLFVSPLHVGRCVEEAGVDNLANCMELNGLLESGITK
ncbi:MAG: hypothetical protein KDD43_02655, partial [Bdellovibrionales bacterium]|nr:hypothetical protein [Bdellovibrionales bacterium]